MNCHDLGHDGIGKPSSGNLHGTYIRWQLRICCTRMKGNRLLGETISDIAPYLRATSELPSSRIRIRFFSGRFDSDPDKTHPVPEPCFRGWILKICHRIQLNIQVNPIHCWARLVQFIYFTGENTQSKIITILLNDLHLRTL